MLQIVAGAALDAPVRAIGSTDLARISPGKDLTSVDVYISSQCNRRCAYCFLPPGFFTSGSRMSLDDFAGVVTWSKRYGVKEITLLGGEPSLHPAFVDMVEFAARQDLKVRVVTNGARRFRRLLAGDAIGPRNLSRVAVSLDAVDPAIQDRLRGPNAWRDAETTIQLLRQRTVPFDINVTAVRSVLPGIPRLLSFAVAEGCRRVNIHWPSAMGIGRGLGAEEIPGREEWRALVRKIEARNESQPGFFVEIERGFLAADEHLAGCALRENFSNLELLPDGRAYRCGLLVDQPGMASLSMTADHLVLSRPEQGEELLRSAMGPSCDRCPVLRTGDRRACIYDKVRSASSA